MEVLRGTVIVWRAKRAERVADAALASETRLLRALRGENFFHHRVRQALRIRGMKENAVPGTQGPIQVPGTGSQ